MAPKVNVKERFTDGEIDLSMSDLDDVPVKEIAQLRKAYSLDLSNNRLQLLPANFITLIHITKLDLSKNEIRELPEDFGNLTKLKYLDLYQNQLQHLPLSFSKLKDLKWLDLKDNPLVPTVAKVAGPCLDTKQCQSCARDVVNFFVKLEKQVNSELESRNKVRQKQLEINQQKKREEKKGKKNEKQKQKQEVVNVQKSERGKGKSKKVNKENKTVPLEKPTENSSLLGRLCRIFFITSILLFVFTSVKLECTKNVELFVRGSFSKGVEKLPQDYQIYAIQGGSVINKVHERTGNVTLSVVKFVNDNIVSKRTCEEIFAYMKNLVEHAVVKVKELYGQAFSSQ